MSITNVEVVQNTTNVEVTQVPATNLTITQQPTINVDLSLPGPQGATGPTATSDTLSAAGTTNNSATGKIGWWNKVCSMTLTSVSASRHVKLLLTSHTTDQHKWATVDFGMYQPTMGTAPIVSLSVDSLGTKTGVTPITTSNFKLVTTQNNATASVVELWVQSVVDYDGYSIYEIADAAAISASTSVAYFQNSAWASALPAGTQTAAVYTKIPDGALSTGVVVTSGNQTIAGIKTFSSGLVISGYQAGNTIGVTSNSLYLETPAAANIYLRPNGPGSNTGLITLTPTGLISAGTGTSTFAGPLQATQFNSDNVAGYSSSLGNNALSFTRNSANYVQTSTAGGYIRVAGTTTTPGDTIIADFKTSGTVLDAPAGNPLQLKPGTADAVYMSLFARTASPSTRSGYFGYGSSATNTLTIKNEVSTGSIDILSTNGNMSINAGTAAINMTASNINVTGNLNEGGQRVYSPNNKPTDASSFTTGTFPDARLPARLGVTNKIVTDWDAATESGWYYSNPAATNAPNATSTFVGLVEAASGAAISQTAYAYNAGSGDTIAYRRNKTSTTWSSWFKLSLSQAEQDARYLQLAGTQTITGTKTFSGYVVADSLRIGTSALPPSDGQLRLGSTSPSIYFDRSGVQEWLAYDSGGAFYIRDIINARMQISVTAGTSNAAATTDFGSKVIAQGLLTANAGITVVGGQLINMGASGIGSPTFTTRSAGTKIVLYSLVDASNTDYGLGIDTNTLWFSAGQVTGQFKWYTQTTNTMTLSNTGALTATSFSGSGASLTSLNGSNISTGTVAQARLAHNVQRFAHAAGTDARPTGTTYVEWVGTTSPNNGVDGDSWFDTSGASSVLRVRVAGAWK